MTNPVELQEIIDNIAQKKHVVSEQALRAKAAIQNQVVNDTDQITNTDEHDFVFNDTDVNDDNAVNNISKQTQELKTFNDSITVLTDIFKQSKFDEIVLLATQPMRLFILNFCIGILKGLGFAVGVSCILFLLAYSFYENITYEFVRQLLE